MEKLIDLNNIHIKAVLNILLKDCTTNNNIIYANNRGSLEIKIENLEADEIQPRICKAKEKQKERTKKKAEVFSPAWLCDKMNSYIDNKQGEKTWQEYVLSTVLEITCGEAPFLASRYDAATGDKINIENRIGLLDRKLRVVNKNTNDFNEWFDWTLKAYQSTYGYEYQGDNLLIARINLLLTFIDNLELKWNREPEESELKKIANIIVWNLWQMDGLTYKIPSSETYARIKDWKEIEVLYFKDLFN